MLTVANQSPTLPVNALLYSLTDSGCPPSVTRIPNQGPVYLKNNNG